MHKTVTLEICAGSLISALIAQTAGAHRIELCENLLLGGTTPSFGTLSLARQMIKIPIHVMIRPRGGDFIYSDFDLSVMKMDIECCKILGFEGVVFGVLNQDKTINQEHNRVLIEQARPMSVTFHRAFDETPEPYESLKLLIELGFDRVLTSGAHQTAVEGKGTLLGMIRLAENKISIMPGGGIRPDNVKEIIDATFATEVHSSAIDYGSAAQETDLQIVKDLLQAINKRHG
jgi:copper homeostasis protein